MDAVNHGRDYDHDYDQRRRPGASATSSPTDSSRFTPESSEGSGEVLRHSGGTEEMHGAERDDDEEEVGSVTSSTRPPSAAESFELYTPDEGRRVRDKLDRRLVLFVALLYLLSFLDRSNIGNARIAGLVTDLGLRSSQYEWLLTAFYITYIVFEWMALLYRVVPPHIYISLCVLSWGLIASLQAITSSFPLLLTLRALLGVSEAAFGPGVPFYLSFFYRRDELAFRTGLFLSAAPLATSFASSLAWLITKLAEGGPIAPWRLLFLVEGFPCVVVAVLAWEMVPDSPETARFLTEKERTVALLRLRKEKEKAVMEEEEAGGRSGSGVKIREVVSTLADPKCYLTAFMFFSANVAFSSMPVFLPTIIKEMGYTSLKSQALSAPPYLFAFFSVLATAYLSDRLRARSAFIILHALLAAGGYALIAIAGAWRWSNVWRYLGLYPAAAGFFSAITIIITWTLNNQESGTQKGAGIAILNIIGQCGPLVGTRLYPDSDKPYYVRGMAICAVFMLLVGVLALVLRIVLLRENWRNVEEFRGNGGEDVELLEQNVAVGRTKHEPFLYII